MCFVVHLTVFNGNSENATWMLHMNTLKKATSKMLDYKN